MKPSAQSQFVIAPKFYQKMTLDHGLILAKPGHLSDRGKDLLLKRNSHAGVDFLGMKLSPLASDTLSLDFKKKILKQ